MARATGTVQQAIMTKRLMRGKMVKHMPFETAVSNTTLANAADE